MGYLLLLAGDPAAEDSLLGEDRRRIVEAHLALVEEQRRAGRLVAAAALDPAGAHVVAPAETGIATDGVFAETKEVLGSFYVVDVEDVEEARALAARMPASPGLRVLLVPAVDV